MTERSNEERLRILQERLAQINQKGVPSNQSISAEEAIKSTKPTQESQVTQSTEEVRVPKTNQVVSEQETEATPPPPKKNSNWIRNIALFAVVVFGAYYAYNNVDGIKEKFNKETNNIPAASEEEKEIIAETSFAYNFKFSEEFTSLIILDSDFLTENEAEIMVSKYKDWGLEIDYFFLPDFSNSDQEIYRVYIGPYLDQLEAENWQELLMDANSIISL